MSTEILVTGATGFIGRRLVRRLVDRHGAAAVSCLIQRDAQGAAEQSGRAVLEQLNVKCFPVDLVSGAGLTEMSGAADAVFHLAANIDTGARDHRVNDVGTRNLVRALSPLRSNTRFVFTSSIAVTDHRSPCDAPVGEHTVLAAPHNEYGRRKLNAEKYLRECAAQQSFRLVIARLCAVYGNGVRDAGIFGQIARMTRQQSFVSRFDYPGKISLMHVDDAVEILLRLADEPMATGETMLVMPVAEVVTLAEMIAASYAHHGKTYRAIQLPPPFWRACKRLAHQLLGFEARLPHALGNKLWQLGLTVGDAFYFDTAASAARFPDMHFRRFRDSLGEIW